MTRQDGEEFLALAPRAGIRTVGHPYPLEKANEALAELRTGKFTGVGVLVVDPAPTLHDYSSGISFS